MACYVVQRAGTYHVRICIPKDFQTRLNKRELHCTLNTGNRRLAKRRAWNISRALKNLFERIRLGEVSGMTDEELIAYVRSYIRSGLDADERQRVMGHTSGEIGHDFPGWDGLIAQHQVNLAAANNAHVEADALALIQQFGLGIKRDSYEYNKICRELMKLLPEFWKAVQCRDKGDYEYEAKAFPVDGVFVPQPTPRCGQHEKTAQAGNEAPEDMLEDVIRRWGELEFGRLAESTKQEFASHTRLFAEILGNIQMSTLGHPSCRLFVDALQLLPASRHKKKKYRTKSIVQLQAMDIPEGERMSARTIKNVINNVGTFLNWAKGQGYIMENYLQGKAPKGADKASSARAPYTAQELNALFLSRPYLEDTFESPFMFWLPILGLYTGARMEELCQLLVTDVKKVDGVWCLDINDEEPKRLKNKSSVRLVPLHPFLKRELRFHKWVERQMEAGERRLFPELEKRVYGRVGHAASKWFGQFKKTCGVQSTFHALRNTFANTCKQLKLEETKVAEVLGHSVQSMTYGHYAAGYGPKILYDEVMKKLSYEMDLSHLRKSRFLVGIR